MSLLCRCLVAACATWSRSWRHATDPGNRECDSRCGADHGVLPQIMEIVEVTAGAVPVVVDVPVIKQRRVSRQQ